MKFISHSEQETFKFAKNFADKLSGGEILALYGDLGSGKTAFTKGIAKELNIKNTITSPTFVLMKVYPVKHDCFTTLVHVDAYRMRSGHDLEAIGIKDYFTDLQCLTVIEWSERVEDILPKTAIKINFKVTGENEREITIKNYHTK
ncbi:MAG: tRNA (adenosine(37)-N6)-threonylcarbamoyltransferase complex ATPase subunit type 1 TsaE [bacterium]